MAKDTRARILDTALTLFSENGYAGTNIRELTASLGLVKSALYRHFKSKQEIWDALLDEMISYYETRFGSPEHLPPVPESLEGLTAMTVKMAKLTVYDEKIIKTRKVLSIEQYRDERAKELASRYFLTGLTRMFTPVFREMMNRGLLRRDDPEMLAFAYTAPISSLIHLCDREPQKAEEALSRIEAFSRHFIGTYGIHDSNDTRNITIRPLEERETASALALAWQVFCRFESPVYGDEGTESFRKTLQDEVYLANIRYYGAFDGVRLIGMLGIRESYLLFLCGRQIPAPRHRDKTVSPHAGRLSGAVNHAQCGSLRSSFLQNPWLQGNGFGTNRQRNPIHTHAVLSKEGGELIWKRSG